MMLLYTVPLAILVTVGVALPIGFEDASYEDTTPVNCNDEDARACEAYASMTAMHDSWCKSFFTCTPKAKECLREELLASAIAVCKNFTTTKTPASPTEPSVTLAPEDGTTASGPRPGPSEPEIPTATSTVPPGNPSVTSTLAPGLPGSPEVATTVSSGSGGLPTEPSTNSSPNTTSIVVELPTRTTSSAPSGTPATPSGPIELPTDPSIPETTTTYHRPVPVRLPVTQYPNTCQDILVANNVKYSDYVDSALYLYGYAQSSPDQILTDNYFVKHTCNYLTYSKDMIEVNLKGIRDYCEAGLEQELRQRLNGALDLFKCALFDPTLPIERY